MFFAIFCSLCQCLFYFGEVVKCQFSRRHHAFRSLKKFITDPRFCFRRKCHMRAVSEASNLPNDSLLLLLLLHHEMPNKFKVWWYLIWVRINRYPDEGRQLLCCPPKTQLFILIFFGTLNILSFMYVKKFSVNSKMLPALNYLTTTRVVLCQL